MDNYWWLPREKCSAWVERKKVTWLVMWYQLRIFCKDVQMTFFKKLINILRKKWFRTKNIYKFKKVNDFSQSPNVGFSFVYKLKAIKNNMEFSHLFILQLRFWSCNQESLDLDSKPDSFCLQLTIFTHDFWAPALGFTFLDLHARVDTPKRIGSAKQYNFFQSKCEQFKT